MKRILLLSIVVLLFSSCSGGDNSSLTPSINGEFRSDEKMNSIPIDKEFISENISYVSSGMLGEFHLAIFPDTLSAQLISKRTTSLGESWIVNGKTFFTVSPCTDCLSIESIGLTLDNYLQLRFSVSHPFPPGDPLKPPTAKNRLDLDIFDLALVIRPLDVTPSGYTLTGASAYTGIVAMNSGYTTELAVLTGDDAAFPYALVIDDNVSGSSTWNKFAMGTESSLFDLFFDVAHMSTFTFDMFLTMGYGKSVVNKSQRLNPTYFNPEFNRKSAWKVNVIPPQGSDPPAVGNTWKDDDRTTTFNVTVEVFDWQQGVTTIANPPVNPGDIASASNVSLVTVEIPGMTSTLPTATTPVSGTGSPSDPLIYTLSVANANLLGAGEYYGLVKVSDERVPGPIHPYGTIDYLIDSYDPYTLVNYSIPEFATYQVFTATVVVGNLPPTCGIHLSKNTAGMGEVIQADPGTSSDPEGMMMSYEYDFNYDGITFDTDAVQNRTDADFGDPVDVPMPCNYTGSPIINTVALRVCDGGTPPTCLICTDDVEVSASMSGSVGDLKVIAINRGEAAADPELITSIDLDWDDFPCAVEYAIERADGFSPVDWTVIGTSTSSSYKFILSDATMDYDQDYRFRVVARPIVGGSPGNDSDPSEEVFVLFMGGLGYFTDNMWAQRRELTAWFFPSCFVYPGIDGVGYGMASFVFVANPGAINCWSLYCSPAIPDIVGQTEAFCDGYVQTWGASPTNYLPPTSGMCIGTLATIPPHYTSTVYDFQPANTVLGASYYAYNNFNVMGLNQEFGETNQAGWCNLDPIPRHTAYYLNDLLDDARDYIALGAANGDQVTHSTTIYWQTDAWAFVVH